MNMRRPVKSRDLAPEVEADVLRLDRLWTECRTRFGAGGPFLFGRFGADSSGSEQNAKIMNRTVRVGAQAFDTE